MSETTPAPPALGIFELDRGRVALPIRVLCEVVSWPRNLTAAPQAAPWLLGMFNLRDQLLPVIDLAGMLDMSSPEGASAAGVLVIVEWREARFALRMSAVGDIVTPDLQRLANAGRQGTGLTPAVFSDPDSGEPVYLLDFDTLMALDGMQSIRTSETGGRGTARRSAAAPSTQHRRALIVRCGDLQLALPATMVHEIQPLTQIRPPVVKARAVLGTVNLRDRQLALFSPLALLCRPPAAADSNTLMVVVTLNQQPLAMAVESVVRMIDYHPREILSLASDDTCQSVVAGLLPDDELGESLLLDEQALAGEQDMMSLAALYTEAWRMRQQENSQWKRFAFVHFEAGGEYVTPLEQFSEVMAMPTRYTPVTHRNPAWRGIISHRGHSLTLIDLRQLLGHPVKAMAEEVLVVDSGDSLIGFMIERTRRIEYIHAPADSLVIRWRGDQEPEAPPIEQCKRLVVVGRGEHKRVLSVLCLESLASLLTDESETVRCSLIDAAGQASAGA